MVFAREVLEVKIPVWMKEQIEGGDVKGGGSQDVIPVGEECTSPVVVVDEQSGCKKQKLA